MKLSVKDLDFDCNKVQSTLTSCHRALCSCRYQQKI